MNRIVEDEATKSDTTCCRCSKQFHRTNCNIRTLSTQFTRICASVSEISWLTPMTTSQFDNRARNKAQRQLIIDQFKTIRAVGVSETA